MKKVLVLGLVVLLVIGSTVAACSQTREWIVYDAENSGLPRDRVSCLAIDEQGNIWMGTAGGGVAVYREGGVILTGVQE